MAGRLLARTASPCCSLQTAPRGKSSHPLLPVWKHRGMVCAMGDNGLGARIAALREARGMTGEELGSAIGLSRSQISKIEHGTRRLDVSEIAEIADVFEVTLGEVLGVERSGSLALAARV